MIRNAFIRPVYTSLKTHNPQNSEVDPDHEQEGEEEGGVLLLALLAFLLSVIFFSFFTQNKGEGAGKGGPPSLSPRSFSTGRERSFNTSGFSFI